MNVTSPNQLTHHLMFFKQKQFTGQIEIKGSSQTVWRIYLCLGRLVWADGGVHPHRSWKRLIDKYCSKLDWHNCNIDLSRKGDSGDYHVLKVLLERESLAREQAMEFVRTRAGEIMFDLLQLESSQQLRINSVPSSTSSFLTSGLQMSVSLVNLKQVLDDAEQEWLVWQKRGLKRYSPNLAPKMSKHQRMQEEVSGVVYQNFLRLLDGQRTLRDLSSRMDKDLRKLTSSLIPYIKQGLLEVVEVRDINPPCNSLKSLVKQPEDPSKPLIACIDDSPQVCKILEQIITQQGYRCVGINESLQAVPSLIKAVPDFIFLDIGMPIANGYEICSQLRRVSKLKHIPIVFLTGNDGIIDRMRAKVAGANAFVTKPIEIEKIVAVIEKFVTPKSTTQDEAPLGSSLVSQ